MKTNTEKTTVIFRRWRTGDTIALFPLIPADVRGLHCTAYEHLGQHGAADLAGVIRRTRPATDAEAAPLKSELERIGYNLTVTRRSPANAYQARRLAI